VTERGDANSRKELPLGLRPALPGDYDWIIDVVDDWWGRPVAAKLPRYLLDHFHSTSIVAESGEHPVGFLVGFHSPSTASLAYINFVAVDPDYRGLSVARRLYEVFIAAARNAGRSEVMAVTSPANLGSIEFHRRLGFSISQPETSYNGRDTVMIVFRRSLDSGEDGTE
jgi:ribosomal protein S18 acetylase RimI-like enzyme